MAREIAAAGGAVTIAGRREVRARRAAAALGPPHRGLAADVNDPAACRAALAGHRVAINCAGPFDQLDVSLPRACLDAGCHYVDIGDDRGYLAKARGLHDAFAEKKLTAACGCSSLPGISGALALLLREALPRPPRQARVVLFIGNRNPKGQAAVRSAARVIGRSVAAPQGELTGFGDLQTVMLPAPFGRRRVVNFDSPDYDLFPCLLDVAEVTVQVGFEFPGLAAACALAARCCAGAGRRLLPQLARCSSLVSRWGSSGGAVLVELIADDGARQRAAMVADRDGQRLAALPAVYVAQQLAGDGAACPAGSVTAYEALGARRLIDRLVAAGFRFQRG